MKPMIAIILVTLAPNVWAQADETVEREMKQDVVLRAMVDELEREKGNLKLEGLESPYFLEYGLIDASYASVSTDLGAVSYRNEGRSRNLRSEVRVGSYVLDNTNFGGGGFGRGAALPIEDDYNAIRQSIWWATDRQYKDVVENFEKKKAFMESKMIEDKPDDFSHESPTVYFEDKVKIAIDPAPLEKLSVALSAIFKQYPGIQNSNVSIRSAVGNKYLVNTEGTRMRVSGSRFMLNIAATVQSDDGMKLSDSISINTEKLEDLPAIEDLSQSCREMIEKLLAIKKAPTLDSYTGPVWFEPEAAVTVFAQQFGWRFAGGQRPVGSQTAPDDFEKLLERRILPRFINVVDDPTRETIADEKVLGHYVYDDQGVKAKPVTLVEQGRLKAQLMSRNPSKAFKNSNGHGRGVFRPTTIIGCLVVTSTDGADRATLRKELLEACADEGLEFGIRVASLGSIGRGAAPLEVYKVYPDGREELVRGMQIARIDLKAFKRMLAAGDTPYVRNIVSWSGSATAAAPAMVFEELDLAKADRDFDKPPIMPNPLARTEVDKVE